MKIRTVLYFLSVYRPIFDVVRGALRGIIDGVIEIHERKREEDEYRRFREDVLKEVEK